MHRPKVVISILIAMLICLAPCVAQAWNYAGHRVIASIAYRQLDEPTKKRISDLLKKHPAYVNLWTNRQNNGPDASLNLFYNASLFPDDARRPSWDKYSRPSAHYVNFRILADQGNKVEPPLDGENIINSYVAHLRKIEDVKTSDEDKALHLSWVMHQAGDVHQPLHSVARFSKALPDGDRGGNGVTITNPKARGDRGNNLHAYWDDLLGTDETPAAVELVADKLIADFPREAFTEELKKQNIGNWAEESVIISLKTVYNNLDPTILNFVDRPVGYDADAERVARRRATLAGYRLADDLKRLFPEK
jgi:hypothetical protein